MLLLFIDKLYTVYVFSFLLVLRPRREEFDDELEYRTRPYQEPDYGITCTLRAGTAVAGH